jgi:hypothetical protein
MMTTMTTTTSPAPARPATTLEWRLYLTAALAGLHLVAWRAIARSTNPAAARPATPRVDDRGIVWLDDLPPGQRPVIALPPGWELVTAETAPPKARQVPRVRPAAPGRRRVRTRSS